MAASVSLCFNLMDGSSQTISQSVGNGHEIVRYDQLIKSLTIVQDQANNILTTLVNQEKAKSTGCCVDDSNVNSNTNGESETDNSTGDDSTDDDEGEGDSTDKPPEKKQKT